MFLTLWLWAQQLFWKALQTREQRKNSREQRKNSREQRKNSRLFVPGYGLQGAWASLLLFCMCVFWVFVSCFGRACFCSVCVCFGYLFLVFEFLCDCVCITLFFLCVLLYAWLRLCSITLCLSVYYVCITLYFTRATL